MTEHKESNDWVKAIDDGVGYIQPDPSVFRRLIRRMSQYNFYRALRSHIQKGDRVMEAGCGWAMSSFALAEYGAQIIAIDISKRLVRTLQDMQKTLGGDIENNIIFENGDILQKYSDSTFDLVFSDGTYEHFPDLQDRITILQNAKTTLKEAGLLAVAVPNLHNVFFHIVVDKKMPTMHPFTITTLSDEIEKHGFDVIETGYSFVNPGFEQWVKSRWMVLPIRIVSVIFRFLPRFLQAPIAAHIYCIAKKK